VCGGVAENVVASERNEQGVISESVWGPTWTEPQTVSSERYVCTLHCCWKSASFCFFLRIPSLTRFHVNQSVFMSTASNHVLWRWFRVKS